MFATARRSTEDEGKELMGNCSHLLYLKKRRIRHSNTTEDVKARLVFIYAVRGLKIFWSAFASLTGLSEQVISRYGRTVTL